MKTTPTIGPLTAHDRIRDETHYLRLLNAAVRELLYQVELTTSDTDTRDRLVAFRYYLNGEVAPWELP